jgi:hypothetical protein
MRNRRVGWAILATAALAIQNSCDSDEGPTGNSGSFAISVSPAANSAQQGASTFVTVTLAREGGFADVVTLTISGAPTGVSASMDPASLSGTTVVSRVDLTVAATAPVGTSTVTITGTSGTRQSTATFTLTITSAPSFTLALEPAVLALNAGSSGMVTVNITRSALSGSIALTLASPPSGITGVFTPSSTTTSSATLQVNADAGIAPGRYTVVIQAAVAGTQSRSVPLAVTVTIPPTAGNNVEYQFCDPDAAPVFFAFQDGAGSWTRVAPATGNGMIRFGFTLTQGRGGVLAVYRIAVGGQAMVRRVVRTRSGSRVLSHSARTWPMNAGAGHDVSAVADVYGTEVTYGITAELAAEGLATCLQTLPTKTVSGSIAGLGSSSRAIVSLGGSTVSVLGGASSSITFEQVQSGLTDLIGSRTASTGLAPDRIFIMRNVDVPDNGTLPAVVDFGGPEAMPAATGTVTISGSGTDALEAYTELVTATTRQLLWNQFLFSAATTRPWGGVPSGSMKPGDLHGLVVFANPASGATGFDYRVALKYVGPVSDQTLAMGSSIAAPTVTAVSSGSYPRYRFQGALSPEYNKGAEIFLMPTGAEDYYYVIASAAYLGGSPPLAYDITMPDVSTLVGFPAAARLVAGNTTVAALGFGFSGPGVYDLQPTLGADYKAASRSTTVVVP